MDAEDLEVFSATEMLASAYDSGERFFPPQAAAINAYVETGGGFFPISVGWGKTLISLMVANKAYLKGVKKSLLLIPPQIMEQIWKRDIHWARKRVPIQVPFHMVGGRSKSARASLVNTNRPGCYIMPYSLLSQSDTMFLLETIAPGLVIADEVHMLKNPRAARAKRVLHYLKENNPEFVGMSGTITSKSINDYFHLVTLALKERSPLPRSHNMAFFWAQSLSAAATTLEPQTAGSLRPLVKWAKSTFPDQKFGEDLESYRRAYRMRLTSAPGVVATGESDIGVSLTISNLEADIDRPGFDDLMIHMEQIKTLALTPNGDEIDHAIHAYKWRYELSTGFYNQLTWPLEEALATRGCKTPGTFLEGAKQHHAAEQEYHKALREFFKDSPPGLDTPREVARSISQHGAKHVGEMLEALYLTTKELQFPGMPERDKSAVLVCDFKIHQAVQWAQEHKRGIIWVHHIQLGKWIVEALKTSGIDPLYCPAGENEQIADTNNSDRIVVSSIAAHGTGKNLQHFQDQLFVQWPRDARVAEQVLGRTHRNGQEADDLIVHTNRTLKFDHVGFGACLNDSVYVSQTTSLRQKIIYCAHDPLPQIFSPEFLREQGANPAMLNEEQRQMMRDLFDWTN